MLQPARFKRWWSRRDEVLPSPPAVDAWSYPQTTSFLPSPPAFLPEFCVTLARFAVGKMEVGQLVLKQTLNEKSSGCDRKLEGIEAVFAFTKSNRKREDVGQG